MKVVIFLLFMLLFPGFLIAQDIIKMGERTTRKVERKVESGINRGIDRTINDAEKEVRNSMKKKKDTKKKAETAGKSAGSPAVTEKYDFVPMPKSLFNLSANLLGSQDETTIYFNQMTELVSLEGQKGKWVKLEPNSAYTLKHTGLLKDQFAMEAVMIPQFNFDNNNEINIGFLFADSASFKQLSDNSFLENSGFDQVNSFTSVVLSKAKSSDDLYITAQTKRVNEALRTVKKIKYIPETASVNKNTFALIRTGNIVRVYYCNRKITSFQDNTTEPFKLVIFATDETGVSSMYLQQVSLTTK